MRTSAHLLGALCTTLLGCLASPSAPTCPAQPPANDVRPSGDSAKVIPYDLPVGTSWVAVEPVVRIDINAQGGLSVDAKLVTDESVLLDALRKIPGDLGSRRVVINADKNARFESVVGVLDVLLRLHVTKIGFGVIPLPSAKGTGATILPGGGWDCEFPAAADRAKIDSAVVVIEVIVSEKGTPERVDVLSDPGHDFGDAARACAMKPVYRPGSDASGKPWRASTGPIRVRFVR